MTQRIPHPASETEVKQAFQRLKSKFMEQIYLPNTIANVLTDHDLDTHTALGLQEVLLANLTIYVRMTGDDVIGDGSLGSPYATVGKAVEHFRSILPGEYSVTINVGEGHFSESVINVYHALGTALIVNGVMEALGALSTTTIGTSEIADPILANMKYHEVIITLPAGKTVSVDDYINIKSPSGGTNDESLCGCHRVSAWDGGTRQATIQVFFRDGSSKAAGTISCTVTLMKTVLCFTNSIGIRTVGPYYGGAWRYMVLEGSLGASSLYGVYAVQSASILLVNCGIVGFTNTMNANNSSIQATWGYFSRCTWGAIAQRGGELSTINANITGMKNSAIFVLDYGGAIATGITCAGCHYRTLRALWGSYIIATNSVVKYNNNGAGEAWNADRWSAIDATGTDTDGTSLPVVGGDNKGSWIIGVSVDGYFCRGDIDMNTNDIQTDITTGTKIGTAANEKIGLWGVTPVIQQAHIVDADGTLADVTTKFNSVLTKLEALGALASS